MPSSSDFSGLSIIGSDLGFRLQMVSTTRGSSTTSKDIANSNQPPDHLLVLVHGIMASPSDWTYADAELKRQLGSNFLIYASSSNSYTKTFSGIDGAGRRLADEVLNVVGRTESLKRISFLAHSLGGLFARYAIAILYSSDTATIAGLEPINFITLATPHLGVRGKKQDLEMRKAIGTRRDVNGWYELDLDSDQVTCIQCCRASISLGSTYLGKTRPTFSAHINWSNWSSTVSYRW